MYIDKRHILAVVASLIGLLLFVLVGATAAEPTSANSVLRSGVWHKVSVTTSGMHVLTAAQVREMGFQDLSKVRIYGAGGNQLSFTVGADERDDIQLMPTIHRANDILFYAEGPDGWTLNSSGDFVPYLNAYSKKAYYFVTEGTDDDSPATRTVSGDSDMVVEISDDAVENITDYDFHTYLADRVANLDHTGRDWVGETYSISNSTAHLPVDKEIISGTRMRIRGRAVSDLKAANKTFTVNIDGTKVATYSARVATRVTETELPVDISCGVTAETERVDEVTVDFGFTNNTEKMYLTNLSFCARTPLIYEAPQTDFRNRDAQYYEFVRYKLRGGTADVRVWDVTKPWAPADMMATSADGETSFLASDADGIHEYLAFDASYSGYPSVSYEGTASNHNLHAEGSVNYLILTTDKFRSVAERLGQLHEEQQGLSWRVVDVDEIYDEFGAGRPEAPAIRNYIKRLYDLGKGARDALKYVLLVGSGSYDNFDRSAARNVIPTYQSEVSYGLVSSYYSEDFYGWMDKGEGVNDTRATLDVAIGRIPCQTVEQLEAFVSKIEKYVREPELGTWRRRALFLGCSGDENEHVGYSESQAEAFESENPDMEVIRLFSESYQRVTTSTGASYPRAQELCDAYLKNGLAVLHYTGHGGASAFADGYVNMKKVEAMTNGRRLPFVVAATCTFVPFDQHDSGVMQASLFTEDNGYIAIFGSGREVYGNWNYAITRLVMERAWGADSDGNPYTIGDAALYAKRNGPKNINSLKYALIGDPALVVSGPRDQYCTVDKANGVDVGAPGSCFTAITESIVEGSVRNADGSIDTTFNGQVELTLLDKKVKKQTSGAASGTPFYFEEWGGKLYSGSVDVKAGHFESEFVLSKEIDLTEGFGRMMLYAVGDDGREAAGSNDGMLVGGISQEVVSDTVGPLITLWIDTPEFENGASTGSRPTVYAVIEDEHGVNVSGLGVGHDLTIWIDGNRNQALTVSDFFDYDAGSYQRGRLCYQIDGLSEGRHEITLKAWDNVNNSSLCTVVVNVGSDADIDIYRPRLKVQHGVATLSFAHNAGDEDLEVDAFVVAADGREMARGKFKTGRNGNEISDLDVSNLMKGVSKLMGRLYILHCEVTAGNRKGKFSCKFVAAAQ